MEEAEIQGRFLPSRVYHRWKGSVRFGLLIVPLIILLSGGITLFLTANKFSSHTVFSLENGPPAAEIVNLVHAQRTLARVSSALELPDRWNVDKETAGRIVDGISEARVLTDTSWIELTVTHTRKVDARDIAEAIPAALTDQLRAHADAGTAKTIAEFSHLLDDASDMAEEKATELARIRKVHGNDGADAEPASQLQRALRASLLADAEVERLQNLRQEVLTAKVDQNPRLLVHTDPVISDTPVSPKVAAEFGEILLTTLISGLLIALLLPYLLELTFPPGPGNPNELHPLPDPLANL